MSDNEKRAILGAAMIDLVQDNGCDADNLTDALAALRHWAHSYAYTSFARALRVSRGHFEEEAGVFIPTSGPVVSRASYEAAVDVLRNANLAKCAALKAAESFISGFEDDQTQEGIPEMLKAIRDALTGEDVKPAPDNDLGGALAVAVSGIASLVTQLEPYNRPDACDDDRAEIIGNIATQGRALLNRLGLMVVWGEKNAGKILSDDEAQERAAQAFPVAASRPMTRVMVHVSGGMVQGVYSDRPEQLDVCVYDSDEEAVSDAGEHIGVHAVEDFAAECCPELPALWAVPSGEG